MMYIAWCCLEEVHYCFSRSSVKFQGHTALKIVEFDPDWAFPDCNSSLNSPMATTWCTKLEGALKRYCFSRSSVKFQGHTALKIVEFDPNWPFPDSNSSLNTPMATKWCTKLEVALKRCPIVFQGHPSNFKVTRLKKIVEFDPNWAFPDCNSSLNSPMATKLCIKLEVALKRCPIVFQGHTSNFKVTRLKKIVDFDPAWAFPDCNSSLNSPMATKWCTKLEAA